MATGSGCAGLGFRRRRGSRSLRRHSRQPLEPLRQVPVPVAEELHRRRQQHAADDRRVDEDRDRQPHAQLLEDQQRQGGEDREDRDHHGGGAGHDAGGGLDPVGDRVLGWPSAVERLADPGEDEHVVIHRESEQDHEQEQRHPRDDRAVGVEAQERLQVAVLEDPHQDSVGRPDREQVEHDRLDRDHDRAERDQQQQEGRRQDEGEDERQVRLHRVVEVLRAGGEATHVRRGALGPARSWPAPDGRGAGPAQRSISSRCRSRPGGCRPPRLSGRD